ncbi:hypothetical protein [Amnibacterium sp.]|uniref:hypothetical protein n=1 Tax=Amnibacterium sp. TaxID=1872496 RepID=UPI003F7B6F98
MTIQYFAANQNLVFVPALFALLAATVVVCLPIAFAPALRRSPRRTPLVALVVVVAVVGLVGTAILAAGGFRTLGNERAAVRTWIATTYGLRLDSGTVGELVDGGSPAPTLPTQAAALGLPQPTKKHALKLVPTTTDGDTYQLTFGGKPLPKAP